LEKKLRITRGKAGPWGYRGPSRTAPRPADRSAANAQRRGRRLDLSIEPAWTHESPAAYQGAVADRAATAHETTQPTIDLQRLLIRADFIRPLAGKSIVFAGRLKCLSPEHAELLASRSGGICEPAVSQQTSILVLGSDQTLSGSNSDQQASQQRQAQHLQQAGRPICILSEEEFLGLVIAQKPVELLE